MAGIGRTPLPPFTAGFAGIIIYFVLQLRRPFLSDFGVAKGKLVKHMVISDKQIHKNDHLELWLENNHRPFISKYPGDYKNIIINIDSLIKKKVTIWYDYNHEVNQLSCDGNKIMEYNWFVPLFLILLAMGLFFHIGAYLETKIKTNNINTYWDMWDYAFGGRVPIMKHNNKPYNPDDVIDLSWGKKKRKSNEDN